MRFNERQLQLISQEEPDHQDRLSYVKIINNSPAKNFKERWFKLKSNLLFYFKFTESGQIESKPVGVIILEGSQLEYEEDGSIPFAFSLNFHGDFDRKYLFAAKSESAVDKWINALRIATYEFKRNQLADLQKTISLKYGKHPPPIVRPPRSCAAKKEIFIASSSSNNTQKNLSSSTSTKCLNGDESLLISFE